MILSKYIKQPRERKDYDINFAPWLDPMGDTLDEVTVTVECTSDPLDSSLTVESPVPLTVSRCKLWVAGGTVDQEYKVTILAKTVGTRQDESELIFTIKDY